MFGAMKITQNPVHMKNLWIVLVAVAGLLNPALGQQYIVAGDTVTEDPMANASDLFDSKEIALVWYERDDNSGQFPVYNQIFDYLQNTAGTIPINQALSAKPLAQVSGQRAAGARRLDIATGNFTPDNLQTQVSAWTPDNGANINLFIPKLSTSLNPGGGTTYQVPVAIGTSTDNLTGKIRVMTGDLDGDGQDEIILAYRTTGTNALTVRIFFVVKDPSGPFLITPGANVSPFNLVANQTMEPFDLITTDLDMDGDDEIAVAGFRTPVSGNMPSFSLVVYDLDSATRALSPKATNNFRNDVPSGTQVAVHLAEGDFDTKVGNELAVSVHTPGVTASGQSSNDTYIYLMRVGDERNAGSFDLLEKAFFGTNDLSYREYSANLSIGSTINAFDLEAGDIDGDGRDELVVGRAGQFDVLKFNPASGWVNIVNEGGFSLPGVSYSYNFLAVGDLDNDRRAEIVYAQEWLDQSGSPEQYKLSIEIFRWNGAQLQLKSANTSYRPISTGQSEPRRFAIALGDFDGDRVRIGQGRRYVKTKIVQPLVILNAPPVHFDILGNNETDLNKCYDGQSCDFRSIYRTSTTTDSLVSTTIDRTWGVSASLSGGGTFAGIGVEASLTARYGEKFNRSGTRKRTFTISQQTVAKEDDWIYATVTDYVIWEYPVFEAGNPAGHILSLTPVLSENRWFDSKSWSAYTYQPDHEVGNILSYRQYVNPNFTDNPSVDEPVRADAQADALTISINSDHTWDITTEDFTENSASKTKEIGLEVGASVSGWGVKVGVTGNYSQASLSTHTTSVRSSTSLSVELKGVDPSVPEARYIVTPYMYWGTNGALTLDYAVRPEEAAPGGTPTFWDANYKANADPAFILPWKYDPEKGFALQDAQKRYQTKSIFLDPVDPKIGDTVTITAYIHNWSLQPTNGPVSMGFYLGHPNQGGIPMVSTTGQQVVSTLNTIPARSKEKITFKWLYDGTTTRFPKIYGYIDPGQAHTEIHENNNIGFVVLEVLGNGNPPLGIDNNVEAVNWVEAYPNPFAQEVNLKFEIESAADVRVELVDLQGRVVFRTNPERMMPGENEILMNTGRLNPGIYFYRVFANNRMATGKLVCRP